jgi:type II secretory pathway pseudopilin PulG
MQCRQRGMSLLELLAAIGVSTVLLIGLTEMITVALEDTKGQQAAYQQAQVLSAARKYIAANYAALVTASASSVEPVTVATLRSNGFLPTGFADTNSYAQRSCVLVRQPSAGKLDALVVTYGGVAIPDRNIAVVAMNSGQGAGYINSDAPGTAHGPSWSMTTTPYRSVPCGSGAPVLTGAAADGGHLASNLFYDGPGQLSTDFIYRDAVAGRPELNRLNVPLGMAGAALVNAGAACGTEIALALDNATRSILVCGADGKWTNASAWKDPVATKAALLATNGAPGDVRMSLDRMRAFAYTNSNTGQWGPANPGNWVPLAIDSAGDLYIPGDLYVNGDTSIGNQRVREGLWVDGNTTSYGETHSMSGIAIWGGQLYVDEATQANFDTPVLAHYGASVEAGLTVFGDVTSDGRVTGFSLRASGSASAGSACTVQGQIRQSSSGLPMVCRDIGSTHEFRYANGDITP